MIELVFVVCLLSAPDRCEERSLAFLAQSGPFACMFQAPPELAAWIGEHPGFRVASWHCEDPARRAQRA
jgi:hypothetical protein